MTESDQMTTAQAEHGQGSDDGHGEPTSGEETRDLSWHLDRIWKEIKDITRQLEGETRRGGQIAKLKLEILGLRRRAGEHTSKLGHLVYEAQKSSDKRPTLARVEGYDDLVAQIAGVESEIDAKQEEIAELKAQPQEEEQEASAA
ncbi:MAG TPA: hypothetical protein QGG47_08735 [Acidobacteriota bacterium]|nr:hypothetical protein [Acidobacteriota bacterium]